MWPLAVTSARAGVDAGASGRRGGGGRVAALLDQLGPLGRQAGGRARRRWSAATISAAGHSPGSAFSAAIAASALLAGEAFFARVARQFRIFFGASSIATREEPVGLDADLRQEFAAGAVIPTLAPVFRRPLIFRPACELF